MRMLLAIAWRNVWRHRTRSLVVMTALALGLWAGNFILAFSYGMYDQRIRHALQYETGHVQFHHPAFSDDGLAGLTVPRGAALLDSLDARPNVLNVTARVIVPFGMIQGGHGSAGVRFVGVDPDREAAVSKMDSRIVEGNWLERGKRNQLVIGAGLADELRLEVGSRPVLQATDVNGDFIALKPRVAGIFRTANSTFDDSRIFLSDETLRRELGLESGFHEVVIMVEEPREVDSTAARLARAWPDLQVDSWKKVAPELELFIESSDQYFFIFIGIILLAVALAVINTMLMAVYERGREIGMLMSVGMTNARIFAMIVLETIFLMGAAAPVGLLLAAGSIAWLGEAGLDLSIFSEGFAVYGLDPLVYPSLETGYYFRNLLLVGIAALVASIFPAWAALRLHPVEAIRKL